MSATDPLGTVWDALDRAGCDRQGAPHKATARCPAHEDRSASLSVGVGADGRALVHCFAGCETEAILGALGLAWSDLFPAGHRQARRYRLPEARLSDFEGNARTAANVLAALEQLGERWRVEINVDCPYCGSLHAQLVIASWHRPFVHCEGACTVSMLQRALAGAIGDKEKAA